MSEVSAHQGCRPFYSEPKAACIEKGGPPQGSGEDFLSRLWGPGHNEGN
jgi:hypothetical protein